MKDPEDPEGEWARIWLGRDCGPDKENLDLRAIVENPVKFVTKYMDVMLPNWDAHIVQYEIWNGRAVNTFLVIKAN